MTEANDGLLVLHGITMSGESMLRAMGPLRTRLQNDGFELIAPNGPHALSSDELARLLRWTASRYGDIHQHSSESVREGALWTDGQHFDWFRVSTDPETGRKTYNTLAAALDVVAASLAGRSRVGVLGFSQGAGLGVILAALAAQGDERFRCLRYGVFLSGFKPVFDEPLQVSYPIPGEFPGLFVLGDSDPFLTKDHTATEALNDLASAFASPDQEIVEVPAMEHSLPRDPQLIERIANFLRSRAAGA